MALTLSTLRKYRQQRATEPLRQPPVEIHIDLGDLVGALLKRDTSKSSEPHQLPG